VLVASLALAGAAGCTPAPPYACSDNAACVAHGVQGICEQNGACSFPDPACASHQRYGDGAPGVAAGSCVAMGSDCVADIVGGGTTEQGLDVGHTCIRRKDGAVFCWGDNSVGQLGGGEAGATSAKPVRVLLPTGESIAAITSGERFVCARADSGNVYCWGDNGEGQLGVGTGASDPVLAPAPVRVTAAPAARALGAGGAHACLAAYDDSVYCWGDNGDRQIAAEAADPQPTPFQVPDVTQVVEVAAGDQHSCGILDDSSVWCWGSNAFGQLGRGDEPALDRLDLPAPVDGLLAVAAIRLGDQHSCALLNDSSLFCWGTNVAGSVGNGSDDNALAPIRILDGVTAVASSGDAKHTCAARVDETLWCWGSNDSGQLGAEPSHLVRSGTPIQVPLSSVKRVGAGAHHSCAVTADGSLWCWGSNHSGQLGRDEAGSHPAPRRVSLGCD
jgi:hypothetical protein